MHIVHIYRCKKLIRLYPRLGSQSQWIQWDLPPNKPIHDWGFTKLRNCHRQIKLPPDIYPWKNQFPEAPLCVTPWGHTQTCWKQQIKPTELVFHFGRSQLAITFGKTLTALKFGFRNLYRQWIRILTGESKPNLGRQLFLLIHSLGLYCIGPLILDLDGIH